jgi:hypothetical protein
MINTRQASTPIRGTSTATTRFVLLGKGRTGSTMLIEALNSHPDITCFGAIFNRQVDFIDYSVDGYDNDSDDDRALRDSDAPAFLRQRVFNAPSEMSAAVGFKYRYGQANAFPGLLDELLSDRDLRVLHLQRRNLLRSMVSGRIAQRTGAWFQQPRVHPRSRRLPRLSIANAGRALRNPTGAARRLSAIARPEQASAWKRRRQPITLSIEECLTEFQTIERQALEYDRLFSRHPKIAVHYEDFLDDRKAAFDRIQDFLGVAPRPLRVTLQRQNPEPLRTLLANYHELYEAFKDTPARAYFD